MWPLIKKSSVTFLAHLDSINHTQHLIIVLFLFCLLQLSATRARCFNCVLRSNNAVAEQVEVHPRYDVVCTVVSHPFLPYVSVHEIFDRIGNAKNVIKQGRHVRKIHPFVRRREMR